MEEKKKGKLWSVLAHEALEPSPIWLMRQAGRYLSEYREARASAGSFWNLCMNPDAAADVTLQPVRRFQLDAAIIFSDILVVPYALGKAVRFVEGEGPRLESTTSVVGLSRETAEWDRRLAPIYTAIRNVAARLSGGIDLIGFAGGPWTLATYMVEGRSSADQRQAKLWAYRDCDEFTDFLDLIADCVAWHLCRQAEAGANVVQIFDSWAGGLPAWAFQEWVVGPTRRVVDQLRRSIPDMKIIGFPRGATQSGYELYVRETGVDGISLDTAVPIGWAVETLGPLAAIQGNLDPLLLVTGGRMMREQIRALIDATRSVPFVANLGHGVLPETPVEHVMEFVDLVRSTR